MGTGLRFGEGAGDYPSAGTGRFDRERKTMNEGDKFERILASLYDVALSRSRWPDALKLIDELIGVYGTAMVYGEGRSNADVRIYSAWMYERGVRRTDVEEEYFRNFYHLDERIPRIRLAPDSQLFHCTKFYTEEELKTSPAFDAMVRYHADDGINVRLDAPSGSRLVWGISNPVKSKGWSSPQLDAIRRILPHIRHTFCVQQALASAGALNATLLGLLESTGVGIVQLDRNGQILEANGRARELLLAGDPLYDRDGVLYARDPIENDRLQELLSRAMTSLHAMGAGGSMKLSLPNSHVSLLLHMHPVEDREQEIGSRPVAALLLIRNPVKGVAIEPEVAAAALRLTRMESEVAVLLAQGKNVQEVAKALERGQSTVRHHIKNMFVKHGLSRQSDLVRLVLSLTGAPNPGRRE